MNKDWNVPWPDGSWLTWNEETEAWEKHEGPPPEDRPRNTTRAADTQTTGAKETARGSTTGKKTTAKKTTAKKTTAKKTTAKKTTARKTPAKETPEKKTMAKKTAATREPPARSSATRPQGEPTAGPSAWRPVAAGTTPIAEPPRSGPPLQAGVPPARREAPRGERAAREGSLLPTIAAGCVVGVAAGYFLAFLIR